MRAIVLRPKPAEPKYDAAVLEHIPLPKVSPGQVLVRLRAAAYVRHLGSDIADQGRLTFQPG